MTDPAFEVTITFEGKPVHKKSVYAPNYEDACSIAAELIDWQVEPAEKANSRTVFVYLDNGFAVNIPTLIRPDSAMEHNYIAEIIRQRVNGMDRSNMVLLIEQEESEESES